MESAVEGAPAAEPPAPDATDTQPPEPVAPDAARGVKTVGVEEIVITGVRLEDTLQSEPVSATTFGGEEIKSLRIQNIQDLADYTANLEINTAFAASNPTLFIRGIGLKDYNANAAGAVAIYQDGININSPAIQLFQLFDVESVQVLRGPQGSVNGRNATAGAIHVTSRLPGDEFDFNGSFSYGNYNNIQAEGGVNLPLIGDALTARVAFTANFRDGNTENQCARWNPQASGFADEPVTQGAARGSINSWLVTPDTLLEEYQKDVDAGFLPGNAQTYRIEHTRRPARQRRLPDGVTAKNLNLDGVCLLDPPGAIITPAGEAAGLGPAGSFRPGPSSLTTLADLQGLKTDINNVDNWAGRGILRFRSGRGLLDDLDLGGMEWILNVHGGQNKSDSRHLQMVAADAKPCGDPGELGDTPIRPCGFDAAAVNDWSEAIAANTLRSRGAFGFEGTRRVKGIDATPTFLPEGGADPYKGWYNQDGRELIDAWGSSLRGVWDLGGFGDVGSVVLTSLTGFEWYERFVEDEGDATPFALFPAEYFDSAWQISQELRADGEIGDLRWTLGGFFLTEQLDALNVFPDTREFRIEQTFDQKLTSMAPYAGATYPLLDELSLQAGVRYNVEKKEFGLGTRALFTRSGVEQEQIPNQSEEKTWTGVTGDVTLTYAPDRDLLHRLANDDLNLYAKYARGMKGGHFNAGVTIRQIGVEPRIEPVEPEFIHAVEAGIKSLWFEDRLRLNAAVFRYWYDNLQVFDIENATGELPLQKLLNSDALVLGAELEIEARPLPGLFLGLGAGWLDSEFVDFTVRKTVQLGQRGAADVSNVFNYDGHPLIAAPQWNFSGIAEYEIPLFGYGWLVPQYSFSYRSKQYLDPQKLEAISQDPYWLHNARLAYRTEDGKIEVAGWVDNIFDEQYRVDVFDVARTFSTITEVWGDPRYYGFTISYHWK